MSSTLDQFATEVETLLKSSATKPWPTFSGGQQTAFEQFQTELKSKFGLTLWGDLFKVNASQVSAISEAVTPANTDDWKAMLGIVNTALAYKTTIETAIEGQRVYLEGVQEVTVELTNQTIKYVGLKQSDPPPPAPFPMSALLSIVLSPPSLIPGGLGSAAAGILKGIISFVQYEADKGGKNAPSPEQAFNDFALASLKIQAELTQRFNDGLNGLTLALNTAVADYGKLEGLAKLLDQPQVTWPQQASGISDAGLKEMEIRLWQLFLPDRWPILTVYYGMKPDLAYVFGQNEKDADKVLDEYRKKWPQGSFVLTGESQKDPYVVPKRGDRIWPFHAEMLAEPDEDKHRCNPRMADGAAKHLFDDLGITREDVFGQKNGWTGFKTKNIDWPVTRPAEWVFGTG